MFNLLEWRIRNKKVMVPVKREDKKDGETEENDYVPPQIFMPESIYDSTDCDDDCYD